MKTFPCPHNLLKIHNYRENYLRKTYFISPILPTKQFTSHINPTYESTYDYYYNQGVRNEKSMKYREIAEANKRMLEAI